MSEAMENVTENAPAEKAEETKAGQDCKNPVLRFRRRNGNGKTP